MKASRPAAGLIWQLFEGAAREDYIQENVEALGASVRLRQSNGRPFVTDEGHHILDCGSGQMPDPSLARKLSEMPGKRGAWSVHWHGQRGVDREGQRRRRVASRQ